MVDTSNFRFIIVNYNSGPWLSRAVASVLEHSDAVISVVDNASMDNSVALSQKHASSRVQYVLNTENVGFAVANNQVLRRLDTDFAVLMNPDCEINADTLAPIAQFFADSDHLQRFAAASCRILNADGSLQKTARRRFPTPANALARMLGVNRLNNPPAWARDFDFGDTANEHDPIDAVPAISGAFMVISKQAIEQIGLLDEAYFMHCEDLDWCKRCENANKQIAFIPSASVVHAKGVSSKSRPIGVLWNLHRGMVRFFGKFYQAKYGWLFTSIVKLGIYASFMLRAAKTLLLSLRDTIMANEKGKQ